MRIINFKRARLRKGLSQKEAAEELGIDQSAVSLWENEKCKPKPSVLVKVAKLYECSVDYLLDGTED